GAVKLFNTADGAEIRALPGHSGKISGATFTPNGAFVVTASADKTIRIWNAADGAAVRTIDAAAPVTSLAVSTDNNLAAAGCEDKLVRLFALTDGAPKGTLTGHTQPISAVQFAGDNQKLVSSSADQSVRVWDLQLRREMQRFSDHKG